MNAVELKKAEAKASFGKGWRKGTQTAPRQCCQVCAAIFYAPPVQLRRGGGKYCSNKCFGATLMRVEVVRKCRKCGVLTTYPSGKEQRRCDTCLVVNPKPMSPGCAKCGGFIFGKGLLYCGTACYAATKRDAPGERVGVRPNTKCRKCSSPFYASPGHIAQGWGIYCSMTCRELPKHGAAKGGTREDLGFYVRSTWEANYARYLKWMKSKGLIADWHYEPETFEFEKIKRGVRHYTPDFRIHENDGRVIYHEVKGYMDDRSRVKLQRMKKYYPQHTVLLIEKKQMMEIKAKLSAMIPNWESGSNDKLGARRALGGVTA